METHDIVVIGGSAGAVVALQQIVAGLPARLRAAVFVVVHTASSNSGALATILDSAGPLPAVLAKNEAPIRRGHIYVARPGHHLLLERGRMAVVHGPRENGFRPAVDPLFRSAARAYGPRVIAVVLSGGLDDGTEGLATVKEAGGITIAQDPAEARIESMPQSAIAKVGMDYVLPAAAIGRTIAELAGAPAPAGAVEQRLDEIDQPILEALPTPERMEAEKGPPSNLTCPECGGALWGVDDGDAPKYRCHVGHGFSAQSLYAAQTNGIENALWTAVRALEEHAALNERMAARAHGGKLAVIAGGYQAKAREAKEHAASIRTVLLAALSPPEAEPSSG